MIKEGVYLHLKNLESPSSCDALCQVWLQSTKAFLREKFTMTTTTTARNKGQILISKAHMDLWPRWAREEEKKIISEL